MNDNIKMINRKLLMPHPDNPRKDLGDLKELAKEASLTILDIQMKLDLK